MTPTKIIWAVLVVMLLIGSVTAAPAEPFPKATYAGIQVYPATTITSGKATLNGHVNNTGTDPVCWFILGSGTGVYGYYSASVVPTAGTGNFSVSMEGMPLMANKTFYYRAVSANGRSSTEATFTVTGVTPIPTTTFSQYWDSMQASNMTPPVFLNIMMDAFGGTFGGGPNGTRIFTGIIIGAAITFLLLRQENITIPLQIGFMAGSILLGLVAPEFVDLAFTLFIIALVGFGYALIRRY
jgi:hypothetical protein